jgi:hypothetical protein
MLGCIYQEAWEWAAGAQKQAWNQGFALAVIPALSADDSCVMIVHSSLTVKSSLSYAIVVLFSESCV